MVSHKCIYQFIRSDKAEGGSLYLHFRHALKHHKRPVLGKQITVKNKVSIDLRPEIINRQLRFGDREIDTITDKEGQGTIVTIMERITGLLLKRKNYKLNFILRFLYSFWERGLNEYTNGLIRQYIPKGTNFDAYESLDINNIQHKINRRPREKLEFDTPIKRFFTYLNNKVALVS